MIMIVGLRDITKVEFFEKLGRLNATIGLCIVALIVLTFSSQILFNQAIPDHSPDVFYPPRNLSNRISDNVVEFSLGGLRRWDAVYFLHIAEHGYTYENCLAFFPLFPFVVRFLASSVLYPLQFVLSYPYLLQLTALLVNLYCFTMAATMLHKLGQIILQNDRLAYKAALLFCVDPASIFMLAPYSEAMFAYLTFRAMKHFEERNTVRAVARFGVCAVARSNGLINFGFILYNKFQQFIRLIYRLRRTVKDWNSIRVLLSSLVFNVFLSTLIYLVLMILPFIIWQVYAYSMFCESKMNNSKIPDDLLNYGRSRNYKIVGDDPSVWCKSYVPFSYSYIQSSHWGVGLFQYYEVKQIPNFLLAVPVLVLSLSATWCYFRRNKQYCLTLGLADGESSAKKTDDSLAEYGLWGTRMFVYMAHLIFLTLTGILIVHVQVLTRFLVSSSPVVFWFAAWLTTDNSEQKTEQDQTKTVEIIPQSPTNLNSRLANLVTDQLLQWNKCDFWTKMVYLYFLGYSIIGTALFSNFLPWT